MIRRATIICLTVATLAFVSACSGQDGPPTSNVAGAVPWFRQETHTYVLKDDAGEVIGRHVLSVDVQNGETLLTQEFTGVQSRDRTEVVVETVTLKPISSTREIDATDEEVLIEVAYTAEGALIRQDDKQTGLSVPEHAYDNDTSLFIWRTLPFEVGYEGSYITVITNQRSKQKVDLFVSGRETVVVPAGEFVAWRLEITTSNAQQVAWYADAPGSPLVRYDNSRGLIFELDGAADTAREPSP